MMRWLWRLMSDRGGQHAEAGVLIAGLVVLGGAVTVGSVPQLSTAVADQWVCNVSDPGSSRCGGDATQGDVKTAKGFTAKTFGATTSAIATSAAYVDPAESHGPPRGLLGNGQIIDVVGQPRPIAARSCTRDQTNCIDELGTYYECRSQVSFDPAIGSVPPLCSPTITDATPLICTDEGLSATTDTCKGPGGIFHCSNPDANGNRTCTEADNDADATIPGGIPVSCGEAFNEDGSATCMGSNGTLYQCPGITEDNNRQCPEGGRNIEPLSLTDCVTIATHSSGSTVDGSGPDRATFENGTKDRVVRCTYTPTTCNPALTEAGSCSDQAVSVRCLVDSPSEAHPEYQHCQSLGQIVPDGQSLQTVCVQGSESAGACDAAVSVPTNSGRAPTSSEPVDISGIDVSVDPGATIDVVVDGRTVPMNVDELTDYCAANASACDDLIDPALDEIREDFVTTMRDAGVCTTDCDALIDSLGSLLSGTPGGPGPRRGLQDDGVSLALGIAADSLYIIGSGVVVASGAGVERLGGVGTSVLTGSLFTAGAIIGMANRIRTHRQGITSARQQATAAIVVQQALAGMRAATRYVQRNIEAVRDQVTGVNDVTTRMIDVQDRMLAMMEEGLAPHQD